MTEQGVDIGKKHGKYGYAKIHKHCLYKSIHTNYLSLQDK